MKFFEVNKKVLKEDFELYYNDLEFEVSDGNYDWSCGAYGEMTVSKDVSYEIDGGEAIEFILEILEKRDPILYKKITNLTDEEFDAYFTDEKIQKFIDKFYQRFLDKFEDRAKEYARDNYDGY